ncbi:histone-lysine N-methyltransferase SMYD3-like [Oppia nitens]|uniref:histone-lysine N-methyltransferase SMYD3-like n=1 Tax=Oppia nitens TaxID=1686743 RepID=UPI0023DA943E|nr:histone-lysine N-methyltransferase SMYD3-like [Oppia nitens]
MIKAQKNYKPLEVVLECPLFVHNVYNKFKGQVCDNCLAKSSGLKKCAVCGHMYYCDRNCQRNDWRAGHRYECQIFKNHYQKLVDVKDLATTLLRLYFISKADPQIVFKKYNTVGGQQRCFNDLMSHQENIVQDFSRFNKIQELHHIITSLCGLQISINDLIDFYGKYVINSFSTCFTDFIHLSDQTFGSGLFIGASVLNHSCAPNVSFHSIGNKLMIISKRFITSGEELTVSYIDHNLPIDTRSMLLKNYYYFDCHCRRCIDGVNDSHDNDDKNLANYFMKQLTDSILK